MKIVLFEAEPWELGSFENLDRRYELIGEKRELKSEILDRLDLNRFGYAAVISRFNHLHMNLELPRGFPNSRLIAARSGGFDMRQALHCILNTTRANIEPFIESRLQNIIAGTKSPCSPSLL